MIDLHTHSLFSDGELVPSELARRADEKGYRAIAITDHGDSSNLEIIIPNMVKVCKDISAEWSIKALPGIELTHVPPSLIGRLAEEARNLGAKIVIVHGETIVEPVCGNTNSAALDADIDILAHPGFITEEEVVKAKKNGICLEISARKGHSLTNGYVASMARKTGAKLVINSDAHAPGDLISREMARKVAMGAGLTKDEFEKAVKNSEELLKKRL